MIQFLYPLALWGLMALAIPVIIHLFNFRKYKVVYFSDTRFLQAVQIKSSKNQKLKHILVLLLRLLTIAAIVLAFAQPFFPAKNQIQTASIEQVGIYVDNSFSMQQTGVQGMLLQTAISKAREITDVFPASTQFQLITNAFEGKHQRWLSKNAFLNELATVNIVPFRKSAREVILRHQDLVKQTEKPHQLIIISDFQRGFFDIEKSNNDSLLKINLVPLMGNEVKNISVDSCWFAAPVNRTNSISQLMVRLRNYSNETIEKIPVKLFVENQQRALTNVDLQPISQAICTLSFRNLKSGIHHGRVEIIDNPIVYDDVYYLSFFVPDKINILAINQQRNNDFVRKIYETDSVFSFRSMSYQSIDYSIFRKQHVIILNEIIELSSGLLTEIQNYVKGGGTVILLPAEKFDFASYQLFTQQLQTCVFQVWDTTDVSIQYLNLQHAVFKEVFEKMPENIILPKLYNSYFIKPSLNGNFKTIIKARNENLVITDNAYGQGRTYLFALPLDDKNSDLVYHPIIVPLFFNMAFHSLQTHQLAYEIGIAEQITTSFVPQSTDQVLKIKHLNQNIEIIPQQKVHNYQQFLYVQNDVVHAGNYAINSGSQAIAGIAFNYNRGESDISCDNADELEHVIKKNNIKNIGITKNTTSNLSQVLSAELNPSYWKTLVLLALMFILLEIVILRFWRN